MGNGIKLFLISQKDIEECEISILSMVGTFHEPEKFESLTFILMTALMSLSNLDTERRGLMDFIKRNNGSYLYDVFYDHSTFDFVIPCDVFERTLELTGSMFSNPIISKSSLLDSVRRIESEFVSGKDLRANSILFNSILLSSSQYSFNNKYSRNTYCDLDTLNYIKNTSDEELLSLFRGFFEENYSSNVLIVAAKSNLSLERMSELMDSFFGKIANKNLPVHSPAKSTRLALVNPYLFSTNKVFISDNQNKNSLILLFPFREYTLPFYKRDPLFFMSKTINSISDSKSLVNLLTKEKLVSSINITLNEYTSGFSNLEITFNLLGDGMRRIPFILKSFFSTIKIVEKMGYNLEYYNESKINRLNCEKYLKKDKVPFESRQMVSNYFLFRSRTLSSLLFGQYEFSDFDVELGNRLIRQVTPENMIVRLLLTKSVFESMKHLPETLKEDSLDCSIYSNLISDDKAFHFLHLTNNLDIERVNYRNSFGINYLFDDLNKCLLEFLKNIPLEFIEGLGIVPPYTGVDVKYEYEEFKGRIVDDMNEIKIKRKLNSVCNQKGPAEDPIKLYDVLNEDFKLRTNNFRIFSHMYYVYDKNHEGIAFFLSFSFPYHISRLLKLNTLYVYSMLFLMRKIINHLAIEMNKNNPHKKFSLEANISVPSSSINNIFAFNLFFKLDENCPTEVIQTLINNMITLKYSDFSSVLRESVSRLSEYEDTNEMNDVLTHLSVLSSNLDLTSKKVLKKLKKISFEPFYYFIQTIFLYTNFNGFIYTSSSPLDAEKMASSVFYGFKRFYPGENFGTGISPYTVEDVKSNSNRRTRTLGNLTRIIKQRSKRTMRTFKRRSVARTRRMLSRIVHTNQIDDPDYKEQGVGLKVQYYILNDSNSNISTYETTELSSKKLNNLQIVDLSSLPDKSKIYFQVTLTNTIQKSFSILDVYLGINDPHNEIFYELILELARIVLKNHVKTSESVEVLLDNNFINSNYYFFSINVSSSESLSDLNISTIRMFNLIFENMIRVLDISLFNSIKVSLMEKFESEYGRDFEYTNLIEEIINKRFNFKRFRNKNLILSSINFDEFKNFLVYVFNNAPVLMYTVQKSVNYGGDESLPCVPDGFTFVYYVNQLFNLPNVKIIKPVGGVQASL
ncbi:insulinase like peptidase [Cryptosporidium ryanae]|uniref:insulinase like peptidase n=1 Tax=Cryptosporidium ryanae TaxID=515981 RepID=UPI00351A49AE|nr:insulinase like peptidase [Cryptosporidium ryanae]